MLIDETYDAAQRAHQALLAARHVHPQKLADWQGAVATALENPRDELVERAHQETHLPAARLIGELNRAARRFMRPVSYQSFPDKQLPPALQKTNVWGITRRIDGQRTPAQVKAK